VEIVTTIAELRGALDRLRAQDRTVGLVPTMGALHAGHVSLMEASAADGNATAATIFVNPLQFAPAEDLSAYPRPFEADAAAAEAAGVEVLFHPDVEEMYPGEVLTNVHVSTITADLEGASRPTHFDGVATVVAKLFSMAGPCRAYFGEKDWQQLQVVTRMAADLSMPVQVVGCPIVRDHDGLALSSRNVYLTPEQREAAPVIQTALKAGLASIRAGERDAKVVEALVADVIEAEPLAELDYAVVRQAATLEPVDPLDGDLRLLAVARFGTTRLLDNVGIHVAGASGGAHAAS
jgi:pantoate--beta-alanine ligase